MFIENGLTYSDLKLYSDCKRNKRYVIVYMHNNLDRCKYFCEPKFFLLNKGLDIANNSCFSRHYHHSQSFAVFVF